MRSKEEVECLKRMVDHTLDQVDQTPGANDRVGEQYGHLCNVSDALSWVLEEVSTEDYSSSDHLNLEKVVELAQSDSDAESPGASNQAMRDLSEGGMMPPVGGGTETIDRFRLIYPRLEQLRIVSRGQKQRQALEEIIAKMMEVRKEISRQQSQRSRLGKKMDEIRHRTRLEVAMALDERGKRLYANEDMRSAALQVELASNPQYRELGDRAYSLSEQIDMLMSEYEAMAQTRDIIAVLGISENLD